MKERRIAYCVLLIGVLALLGPAQVVYADAGPKPGMHFTLTFEGDPLAIVQVQLIECEDETCADGQPLEELGPQRITCTEQECSSIAYGYAPYHKLVIEFEDRTRESNVFTKRAYNARYEVTVTETGMEVVEKRGLLSNCFCCPGLFLTLILETTVAGGYLRFFRLPRSLLAWVPLASLLTLPVVWLGFPLLAVPERWVLGLAEAFAVVAEAGLLYLASMRTLPLRHAALLSLAMNAASFAVGLLL